ncbi:hypothetical protein L1887_16260 [Cichorium endivia]|nr:hypothetical protein L1887_16260 [Cichorium endivia]
MKIQKACFYVFNWRRMRLIMLYRVIKQIDAMRDSNVEDDSRFLVCAIKEACEPIAAMRDLDNESGLRNQGPSYKATHVVPSFFSFYVSTFNGASPLFVDTRVDNRDYLREEKRCKNGIYPQPQPLQHPVRWW